MAELSNLGTTVNFSTGSGGPFTSACGVLLKLSPPQIKNATLTAGQSGSYLQRIPGKLLEISPFKATFGFDKTSLDVVRGYCTSSCTIWSQILYSNNETWLLNCVVTGFKPIDYDPEKPDVLAIELEIDPAGTISFS